MRKIFYFIRTAVSVITITIIMAPLIIIAAPFSKNRVPSYYFGKFWSWLILKTNRVKIITHGIENLAKYQSYVFISNHLSHLDTPAAAVKLPNQLRFVAKASLKKIPVFGFAARTAKMIFIDRDDKEKSITTINKTIDDLRNGISAFFFGEGTRSHDGIIRPLKKGGIILAIKARLPIAPVTIIGSNLLMPSGKLYILPGIMKIIVGDPIDTAKYSEQTVDELMKKIQETMTSNYKKYSAVKI
jgi:1-acyl-sn-glycerol-3-phosphate acyltransferase